MPPWPSSSRSSYSPMVRGSSPEGDGPPPTSGRCPVARNLGQSPIASARAASNCGSERNESPAGDVRSSPSSVSSLASSANSVAWQSGQESRWPASSSDSSSGSLPIEYWASICRLGQSAVIMRMLSWECDDSSPLLGSIRYNAGTLQHFQSIVFSRVLAETCHAGGPCRPCGAGWNARPTGRFK